MHLNGLNVKELWTVLTPELLKKWEAFRVPCEDKIILGLADKITQHQLSGLHFKQDEQEDKAAFEIQTQVNKKKKTLSLQYFDHPLFPDKKKKKA